MDTYVYILLNPRKKGYWSYDKFTFDYEPFYVGIGVGQRMNSHFNLNRKKYESNYTKYNLIESIIKSGNKPISVKLYGGLVREKAKIIEVKLIKFFGKLIDGTGILTNITNGGDETLCNKLDGNNLHSKKVFQYSLNGKFIKSWASLRGVGRKLNKSYNTIGDCCRGNIKTAYGFQWFFEYKGVVIPPIKKRSQPSRLKKVYKFTINGELIDEYVSLSKAAELNEINKGNLSESIRKGVFVGKYFFSYSLIFKPIIQKKSRLHKILYNNQRHILTNDEIMKMFNVSKYYIFEVKRNRIKNPLFIIDNQ